MNSVAALIILYNPTENFLQNIFTVKNQVDLLYIVDNSENETPLQLDTDSSANVDYIHQNENIGVAAALNITAKKAIEEGYKYLLTLDQDTVIPENLVSGLLNTIRSSDSVAIAAPFYSNINYEFQPEDRLIHEKQLVITSANLVDLAAYQLIGPFRDDMFIDYVDFEYCLRLSLCGYKILQNNAIIVQHNVGNLIKNRFLAFNFYTTNHSSLRLYYKTRNRLYLRKIYGKSFPVFFKKDRISLLKESVKILLVEKDKIQKFKMMRIAYKHFRLGKLGKFQTLDT